MLLTGRDVWEALVKIGVFSGPYDPRNNRLSTPEGKYITKPE
jgi:hypothetical protein